MDTYLETNISLLVRLSKEASVPVIEENRYVVIAKGISEILNTIEKHHGIAYLHYVIYLTTLRLGHGLGPLNATTMNRLIKQGCTLTKIIYV